MTLEEYTAIAAACDQWLRAPDTSLARLAIPLLHVIKEHPGLLRQYEPALCANAAGGATSAHSTWHTLHAGARAAARILWRSARQSAGALRQRASHGSVQVLIISHLTSPSQLNRGEDAYFGGLPRWLHAHGIGATVLLIDHLRDEGARRACAAQLRSGARQLLPRAVPVLTELRIWWQCLKAAWRLRRQAAGAADFPVRAIGLLASRAVLSGQTLANLRLHAAVARRCAQLRPSLVITTHEGDACERVIWHAARSVQNPPLCVGYQHALLLQHSHAIRRCIGRLSRAADPDVILTLGPMAHAMLAASPQLRGVRLIAYGSHRHTAIPQSRPWPERQRHCLVLPDAQESESVMLFNFALSCAQHCPDMTFVLRPHPIVDFVDLARLHSNLRRLPQNVRLSSEDLAHECAQARYCLYRGSSASLEAVRCGAKPLYLARPSEFVFDPLFTLGEWRATVSSPEEFVQRVRQTEAAPDLSAAQRARDEIARYISPMRPAAIDELLTLAASSHRGQALGRDFGDRFA